MSDSFSFFDPHHIEEPATAARHWRGNVRSLFDPAAANGIATLERIRCCSASIGAIEAGHMPQCRLTNVNDVTLDRAIVRANCTIGKTVFSGTARELDSNFRRSTGDMAERSSGPGHPGADVVRVEPSRDVDMGVDKLMFEFNIGHGDLNAVEQTVVDLTRRIDAVLAALGEFEPAASAFFLERRRALSGARDEADLINIFIALSTTAFQGFEFPPRSLGVIDELLADAERIAFTFTADGEAH